MEWFNMPVPYMQTKNRNEYISYLKEEISPQPWFLSKNISFLFSIVKWHGAIKTMLSMMSPVRFNAYAHSTVSLTTSLPLLSITRTVFPNIQNLLNRYYSLTTPSAFLLWMEWSVLGTLRQFPSSPFPFFFIWSYEIKRVHCSWAVIDFARFARFASAIQTMIASLVRWFVFLVFCLEIGSSSSFTHHAKMSFLAKITLIDR